MSPDLLRTELTDGSAAQRALALETAFLRHFAWDAEGVPVRPIAHAYERLSSSVLAATKTAGRETGSLEVADRRLLDAVWAFVYGARSFHVLHRLLGSFSALPLRVADIGGGWGPAALWSALRGGQTTVFEAAHARLELCRGLFSILELPVATSRGRFTPSAVASMDAAVWSYSLREMVPSPETAADLILETRKRLSPPGRILVVESGARPASEFLMALRDELVSRGVSVVAPCPRIDACPARASADWCHFTWRMPLGPIGSRIAAIARRKAADIHFCWLMLDGDLRSSGAERVLSTRSLGKQGDLAVLCGASGLRQVRIPSRLKGLRKTIQAEGVGQLVDLPDASDASISNAEEWVVVESL